GKITNFNSLLNLKSFHSLCRGRCAVVRKCIAKSTGQEYAAKFLKKRRRGQDCKAEILHEIAVLELTKSSPRVVNLHEVYEMTNEIILRIEENDIIRLIRQILEGLCCLHENNIVHLDLKPQNILLSNFGMSRKIENTSELRQIIGTTEYLAPVIIFHPKLYLVSFQDIGVISYMLLIQESPFVGADNQETFLNISQINVDYSEETLHQFHTWARDFIQKLLVKNPDFFNKGKTDSRSCLSHSCPEESSCIGEGQDTQQSVSEERNIKSICNGTCGDKADKENIPEDSSTVSKRFRFDDSLQDFMTDLVC
uniref:non-specific serine/threonine protein kinase n=1 Tax=Gopherus evgoodei TaxID=1825980 RepID=A0A8C4WM23_9SAUR